MTNESLMTTELLSVVSDDHTSGSLVAREVNLLAFQH